MSEKSRKEQKVLGVFLALAVTLASLITLNKGLSDAIWWVYVAIIYDTIIGIVIFAELIDEADIETRKKLGTYVELKPDLPEELVTRNRMASSYISMSVREKFERCVTDQTLCNSQNECITCPADMPDDVFDALTEEQEMKEQINATKMPEMQ